MASKEIKNERERKRVSGLVELKMQRSGVDLESACRLLLEESKDEAFMRHVKSIQTSGLSRFDYRSV